MTTKEEAKKQFDRVTKELNLTHYFSFDEAWEFMTFKREQKERFRNGITQFDEKMHSISDAIIEGSLVDKINPVKHTFIGGCYVREIFNPKGELIVTKIHKKAHPFFLLKGEMSILTEKGVKRIKAPYSGVTLIGTRRIIFTHEPCVFVTVHAVDSENVEEAEKEIIADSFDDADEAERKSNEFVDLIKKENEKCL